MRRRCGSGKHRCCSCVLTEKTAPYARLALFHAGHPIVRIEPCFGSLPSALAWVGSVLISCAISTGGQVFRTAQPASQHVVRRRCVNQRSSKFVACSLYRIISNLHRTYFLVAASRSAQFSAQWGQSVALDGGRQFLRMVLSQFLRMECSSLWMEVASFEGSC